MINDDQIAADHGVPLGELRRVKRGLLIIDRFDVRFGIESDTDRERLAASIANDGESKQKKTPNQWLSNSTWRCRSALRGGICFSSSMEKNPVTAKHSYFLLYIALIALLLSGCSARTRHKIKSGFQACCAWSVVILVIGGVGFVWVTNNRIQDAEERRLGMEKAKEHSRMIREAPSDLEFLSLEFQKWAPQCAHVIQEEGYQGRVYEQGSDAWRTHEKSLRMLNHAWDTVKLLHENDISQKSYDDVEAIKRLKSCCMSCPAHNRGKRNAQCLILSGLENQK